jgi:hypothetical protein
MHLQAEAVLPTTTAYYAPSVQYVTIILRSNIVILLNELDRFNNIVSSSDCIASIERKKKLRGFGPRANYADRATATCWGSSANF